MSAVGPSRPAEPPEPIVIADAIIFTGATRARMVPPVQCRALTTVSVPWPSVSGREVIDGRAGDQAAQRRRHRNQPQPMRADRLAQHAAVLRQIGRRVPRQTYQKQLRGEPQQPGEQLRAQPADDSED